MIIENKWLSDKHMSAVNKILSSQFPLINGLQDTTLTIHFIQQRNVWNTDRKFKRNTAPCAQIHFECDNHWTCSIKSIKDEDAVYFLDSLGINIKVLKNNIQIQLSQVYDSTHSKLNVKIPRIQQQPNSFDCGLFAIANVVDFCHNPNMLNFNTQFSVSEMRSHLIHCLENNSFTLFPREPHKSRPAAFTGIPRHMCVKTTCKCAMPEFIDFMIFCSYKRCKNKFHYACVGLKSNRKSILESWKCNECN
jgi:hypothetical protein